MIEAQPERASILIIDGDKQVRWLPGVSEGKIFLTPISKFMSEGYSGRVKVEGCPLDKLTARQSQVLRFIAEGKTTKQVALELNISVKTVESHRAQLMDRLDIHDIAGLVKFAIRVGLITLED